MNNQGSQSPGRVVAWCALLLGAAMSVAANALHVLLVTGPATGDTSAAQVIGAAFWPVALILAVEVMARVVWPGGLWFALLRWCGVGAVALVAAIVSYGHMHGLLLHWGETTITALLGPIGVDGLVTVGAVALMATGYTPPTTAPAPAPAEPKPEPAEPKPDPIESAPVAASSGAEFLPAKIHQAPTERTPFQPEPVEPEPVEPVPVGPSIDETAVRSQVPPDLQATVIAQLRKVLDEGRTPEPDDLPDLPPGFARRVITTGINGHN